MKYAVSGEFGALARFKTPMNGAIYRLARVALSAFPKGMRTGGRLCVQKRKITCADGKKITAYILAPRGDVKALPLVFYLHGGAFVFKGAPYHYKLAKEYALRSGCAVMFTDYRPAYNTPYGTPLSDCFSAYSYAVCNAEGLNIDRSRICLAGDSAGGYLCLALLEKCRAAGVQPPSALMLVYPVADPKMRSQTMRQYVDTPVWNARLNSKMWKIYKKGNGAFDPFLCDFSLFPPSYVETAEFDCLRGEGEALARKIAEAGVSCTLNATLGTVHGFDMRLKAPKTRAAVDRRIEFLKNMQPFSGSSCMPSE